MRTLAILIGLLSIFLISDLALMEAQEPSSGQTTLETQPQNNKGSEAKKAIVSEVNEKAFEKEWGNLSGRFVASLNPPKPQVIANVQVRGRNIPIVNRTLVVNPKNLGVQNVLVQRDYPSDNSDMPSPDIIHKDYESIKAIVNVEVSPLGLMPRIFLVNPRQSLRFTSIAYSHQLIFDAFIENDISYINLEESKPVTIKGPNPEDRPVSIRSQRHWVNGYLLVTKDPYVAITDRNGYFKIKNLPVGPTEFRFWHERLGIIKSAKQDGESQSISRLRLNIEPGNNNVGEIVLDFEE